MSAQRIGPDLKTVHSTLARTTGRISIMLARKKPDYAHVREALADIERARAIMLSVIERLPDEDAQ